MIFDESRLSGTALLVPLLPARVVVPRFRRRQP